MYLAFYSIVYTINIQMYSAFYSMVYIINHKAPGKVQAQIQFTNQSIEDLTLQFRDSKKLHNFTALKLYFVPCQLYWLTFFTSHSLRGLASFA